MLTALLMLTFVGSYVAIKALGYAIADKNHEATQVCFGICIALLVAAAVLAYHVITD